MSEFIKLIITVVLCGVIYAMWHFGLWEVNKIIFIIVSLVIVGIGIKMWLD